MNNIEFSNQFDVLYNNITSNQAAGLNEYEKSVLLTKAQDEKVKNYFFPEGNDHQKGYDEGAKRQMDFSMLMDTLEGVLLGSENVDTHEITPTRNGFDPRAYVFKYKNAYDSNIEVKVESGPMFIINESIEFYDFIANENILRGIRQVLPISYDEYTRLMSKPFKEPLKNQAWRLVSSIGNSHSGAASGIANYVNPDIEIILTSADISRYRREYFAAKPWLKYKIRCVRKPRPIILADFTNTFGEEISINNYNGSESFYSNSISQDPSATRTAWDPCELAANVHEEILQRAVELAKAAWEGSLNSSVEMGKRSE